MGAVATVLGADAAVVWPLLVPWQLVAAAKGLLELSERQYSYK
jgi:hypothetical protein